MKTTKTNELRFLYEPDSNHLMQPLKDLKRGPTIQFSNHCSNSKPCSIKDSTERDFKRSLIYRLYPTVNTLLTRRLWIPAAGSILLWRVRSSTHRNRPVEYEFDLKSWEGEKLRENREEIATERKQRQSLKGSKPPLRSSNSLSSHKKPPQALRGKEESWASSTQFRTSSTRRWISAARLVLYGRDLSGWSKGGNLPPRQLVISHPRN